MLLRVHTYIVYIAHIHYVHRTHILAPQKPHIFWHLPTCISSPPPPSGGVAPGQQVAQTPCTTNSPILCAILGLRPRCERVQSMHQVCAIHKMCMLLIKSTGQYWSQTDHFHLCSSSTYSHFLNIFSFPQHILISSTYSHFLNIFSILRCIGILCDTAI